MQTPARLLRGVAAILLSMAAVSAQAYYPEWSQKSTSSLGGLGALRTGDLNGDGRPDVLVRNTSNHVYVMLTNSDGTLGSATLVYTGTTVTDILLADFNNDGKVDAVVADTGTNSLIALPGNGDGTFATPVVTALTIAPTELALGDFSGDNHPDVLVRSTTGPAFAVYTSDGALQFSLLSSVALTSSPYRTAVADVDGDGKTDVVIGLSSPAGLQVHFGKGDGTFDAAVPVAGASTVSSDIALGDLDNDGHLDIVTSQYSANQVTVILNGGSGRTFAAAVSYEVRPSTEMVGNPKTIAVLDATDDGKPDVVAILFNNGGVVTLPGNGDGTLGSPLLTFNNNVRALQSMAVADFTSDGRPDLVVASPWNNYVVLLRNAPGELLLNLTAAYPTISAGQAERFTASANVPVNVWALPPILGTVTVNEGATAQGSGDMSGGSAIISVSSLPVGTHTLSAALPASTDYKAVTSSTIAVNVTSETTTTTLTSNHAGQAIQYGTELILSGNVTSPIAGSLYGSFWLYTDGQRSEYTASGPPLTIYPSYLPPGTHSFYVTYEGNATQPPSTSNTVTQQIVKADSHVELLYGNWWGKYGEDLTRRFALSSAAGTGTVPGGDVHVYEGRTLLLTTYADPTHFSGGMSADFNLPVLPVGTHYLYATYDGDSNYNPSRSAVVQYDVLGSSMLAIRAVGDNVNHRVFVWGLFSGPNAGYDYFVVHRRVNSGPWSIADADSFSPGYTEYNPASGAVYTYYIEAFDSSNHLLATSNVDSATLTSFTDDPLTIDTPIKAQHLTELVTAVNVFRTAASLQPIVLPSIAPNGTILATHLTALQNGLNEARAVLGSGTFAFTGGAAGTPIKAQHVQDLREAIR